MHRLTLILVYLMLSVSLVPRTFAQTSGNIETPQLCDKVCQQKKVDALFKALDDANVANRPKPSDSTDCVAYDGHAVADVLIDVCRKLKYVRILPIGTGTNFSCPQDTRMLLGRNVQRIRSIWGEPDFVDNMPSRKSKLGGVRWTYFIGSPKPGQMGGGFPELSLELDQAGDITHVSCDLAQ